MNKPVPTPTFAGESLVRHLPLNVIVADAHQVRRTFDDDALQQLADSIREHGVIQPIVVRPIDATGVAPYVLIAGERRWRASKLAGIEAIPAVIRTDLVGQDVSVLQILENLQRQDLTLPEASAGVTALVEKIGNAEAAKQLGKSEAWVSKHARLVELPERIRAHIENGQIESADVAHELHTLLKLDEKKAGDFLETLEKPEAERQSWDQMPTRAAVRVAIEDAKEEAAHRKAIAAKRKSGEVDPQERAYREQQKAAEKARADTRERIKRLEAEVDQLEDEALQQFGRIFSFAPTERDERGNRINRDMPVSIRSIGYFNEYDPRSVPKTIEPVEFLIDADGDAAHMLRVAKATGWQLDVNVRVERITTAQAVQLEKLLGKQAVSFSVRQELKGRDVRKLIKQLAGVGAPDIQDRATGSDEQLGDLDVAAFVAEKLDRSDPSARTMAADVHTAYVAWCKKRKAQPLPLKGADNAWANAIAAAGIQKKRFNVGFFYLGVSVRS